MFDGDRRLLVSTRPLRPHVRPASGTADAWLDRSPGLRGESQARRLCLRDSREYANKLLAVVAERKPTTRIQEPERWTRHCPQVFNPCPTAVGWPLTRTSPSKGASRSGWPTWRITTRSRTRQSGATAPVSGRGLSNARERRSVAVLCLDLDRFKEVNDTLVTGRRRPAESVATRLRGCVSQTDTVRRLGGDEFAIVQAAAEPAHGRHRPGDARHRGYQRTYDIDGQPVVIGTSIGIAVSPGDGATGDDLLRVRISPSIAPKRRPRRPPVLLSGRWMSACARGAISSAISSGPRQPRIRAALPAAHRRQAQRSHGLRGPLALEPPRARQGVAG